MEGSYVGPQRTFKRQSRMWQESVAISGTLIVCKLLVMGNIPGKELHFCRADAMSASLPLPAPRKKGTFPFLRQQKATVVWPCILFLYSSETWEGYKDFVFRVDLLCFPWYFISPEYFVTEKSCIGKM